MDFIKFSVVAGMLSLSVNVLADTSCPANTYCLSLCNATGSTMSSATYQYVYSGHAFTQGGLPSGGLANGECVNVVEINLAGFTYQNPVRNFDFKMLNVNNAYMSSGIHHYCEVTYPENGISAPGTYPLVVLPMIYNTSYPCAHNYKM